MLITQATACKQTNPSLFADDDVKEDEDLVKEEEETLEGEEALDEEEEEKTGDSEDGAM